jgi:hypothetical protein
MTTPPRSSKILDAQLYIPAFYGVSRVPQIAITMVALDPCPVSFN